MIESLHKTFGYNRCFFNEAGERCVVDLERNTTTGLTRLFYSTSTSSRTWWLSEAEADELRCALQAVMVHQPGR